MSTFDRQFAIEKITGAVLEKSPWLQDLLSQWRPAGDALRRDMTAAHRLASTGQTTEEDPGRLRLAVRNGYVNFYRGGQSVAKISFSRGLLKAEIHNKYIYGEKGSGQSYVTLTSEGIPVQGAYRYRAYGGRPELKDWISGATKRAGPEKLFVDMIMARNADTIDLEMALPAHPVDLGKKIAPRIDLVVLEPVGDKWQVVFWEAKLVDDSRARCSGSEISPEVVAQLAQYSKWLQHDKHTRLVTGAYQSACRLLVAFHDLAKSVNPDIEDLGRGIIAVAAVDAPPLLIDVKPRLLIDDRAEDATFAKNGHLRKLRSAPHALHVQMVSGLHDMALEAHQ